MCDNIIKNNDMKTKFISRPQFVPRREQGAQFPTGKVPWKTCNWDCIKRCRKNKR